MLLNFAHFLHSLARQDECWGEIFRSRHLKAAVGAVALSPALSSSARQLSSTSSRTHGKLGDVAAPEDSDAPAQNRGLSVLIDAPLRKAVIAHARSLSRALCLFDVAVSDGGTTKAVVNGPVRAPQKALSRAGHHMAVHPIIKSSNLGPNLCFHAIPPPLEYTYSVLVPTAVITFGL